jgi:hypothetical protein
MKITKIENNENWIYTVYLEPNLFEKLIGIKHKIVRYKDTGDTYTFGGQTAYIKDNGERCGNGDWIAKKIDNFRRIF